MEVFGTPRRLAVRVMGLPDSLPDTVENRMGPAKKAAFDAEGNPTKAALGFARSAGVDISEVGFAQTPKGEYLCVTRTIPGGPADEFLRETLQDLISQIPFPKAMRWSNPSVRFARPVHWIVALFGEEVLPVSFGSVKAGRQTRGNRFMAGDPVDVPDARGYENLLTERFVIPDIEKRKTLIWEGVGMNARNLKAQVKDKDLLDEVANLVEYPHVIIGRFDDAFLELPVEVLVTVMKHHQRYFPMYSLKMDRACGLFRRGEQHRAQERRRGTHGLSGCSRPASTTAKYFFEEDLKVPLEVYAEKLKNVIFHKDLGTSYEKMERFRKVALYLADILAPAKKEKAAEAAYLCKADLNSLMVCELPELQGIMGREYALRQGRDPEVARAIREHYLPSSAEDELPSDILGDLVGIADRIDTICGCFGVGLIPTGTSDPFALRRQTIAIENILLAKGYRISISELIDQSLLPAREPAQGRRRGGRRVVLFPVPVRLHPSGARHPRRRDRGGAAGLRRSVDTFMRAQAIAEVKQEEWFASISSASKRVENILKRPRPGHRIRAFFVRTRKGFVCALREMETSFITHADRGSTPGAQARA